MAFTLIQAGDELQFVDGTGTPTDLVLPEGITLRTDIPPRFTVFGRFVVVVNTPDEPLTVDETGTVRLLCPRPPRTAAILTAGSAGSLSGTFKVIYTFIERDENGLLIFESDFSPISNSLLIASKFLKASHLDVTDDPLVGRRLYRTTTGTDTYFQWFDIEGNVVTSAQDDLSDAGLSTFSSPARGTPPYLQLITEFRSRLFGVGHDDPDNLRYSEVSEGFAWPEDNFFPVPHVGEDKRGVTALIPRRDALGVARLGAFLQLTGTDDTNFRLVKISENVGVESQESVVIYKNIAYFLWRDGVYSWSDDGIKSLSDEKVRSWFTTDDTFNRGLFSKSFASLDPKRNKYKLFLASAGSSVIDSWIELDLIDGTWWGPHTTEAFAPTSAFVVLNDSGVKEVAIGTDEFTLNVEQTTRQDATLDVDTTEVAIPVDALTNHWFPDDLDHMGYWGELSLFTKAQEDTESVLTVTPYVGEPEDDTAGTAFTYDLTSSRERLGRLGVGRSLRLQFTHETAGETVEITGLDIDPISIVGRR